MLDLSFLSLRAVSEALAVIGNRRGKFVDAFIFRSYGANNRRLPAVAFRGELQHRFQLRFEPFDAVAVRFIQHENVRDLHQAGLHILHIVAHARHEQDQRAVCETHDIHFILADAHGFDEHVLFSGGVENQRDIARGPREATEKSTRRHRPDENSRIAGVALHAYAVAENRSARVRARGIDGNDANVIPRRSVMCGQTIDQRALSGSGRAGHSNHKRRPGMREKFAATDLLPADRDSRSP